MPPAPTVSALPRELLIAEGFRTLIVPLLFGGAVAVLVYFTRSATGEVRWGAVATKPPETLGVAVKRARMAAVAAFDAAEAAMEAVESATRAGASVAKRGPARDVDAQIDAVDRATWAAREQLVAATEEARRATKQIDRATRLAQEKLAVAKDRARWQAVIDSLQAARRPLNQRTLHLHRRRVAIDRARMEIFEPPPAASETPRGERARRALERVATVPPEDDAASALGAFEEAERELAGSQVMRLIRPILDLSPIEAVKAAANTVVVRTGILGAIATAGVAFVLLLAFGALAVLLVGPDEWFPAAARLTFALCVGFGVGLLAYEHVRLVGMLVVAAIAVLCVLPVGWRPEAAWQALVLGAIVVLLASRRRTRGVGVVIVVAAAVLWFRPSGWFDVVAWSALAGGAGVGAGRLLGDRSSPLGVFLVVAAVPAAELVALAIALQAHSLTVVLMSAVTVWLALGAMYHWRGPGPVAWILFAAIAFWSGALAFIGEFGADEVSMERVVVKRKSVPAAVHGLYLGRTAKSVLVASDAICGGEACRRVLTIGEADVGCVVFGPETTVAKPSREPLPRDRIDVATVSEFRSPTTEPADPCAPKATATSTAKPSPAPDSPNMVTINLTSPRQPATELVLRSDVLFRYNQDKPTRAGRAQIRKAAAALKATNAKLVFVAGHTDSHGSEASNDGLARRRAINVRDLLRRVSGAKGVVYEVLPHGESRPLWCEVRRDGSDDWIARAYDRRVEITTDEPVGYEPVRCHGRP